jgi:hypothetical protein
MSLLPARALALQHYWCLVEDTFDEDGMPVALSPLAGLAARYSLKENRQVNKKVWKLPLAGTCSFNRKPSRFWRDRLPGLEKEVEQALLAVKIELDKWQVFRLATPFAEELEVEEAETREFSSGAEERIGSPVGIELSISIESAMNALGGVLPGLRARPNVGTPYNKCVTNGPKVRGKVSIRNGMAAYLCGAGTRGLCAAAARHDRRGRRRENTSNSLSQPCTIYALTKCV